MVLWTPVIVFGLACVALAVIRPDHLIGRLAKFGLWMIPIGALLDVQYRLYQYGHGVQNDAPIRLDPFTPLVIGPTKVLNFTTWAYPGLAIWCLFGGAFLVTFAPSLVHRVRERWHPTRLRLRRGVRGPRACGSHEDPAHPPHSRS